MGKYYKGFSIEVKEEEIDKIFKDLEAAKRTIYDCYYKLEGLGIVKFIQANETSDPNND